MNKEALGFDNGPIVNRVVKYVHDTSMEMCIFVPNWRAKMHHWDGFCDHISQYYNLEYFETREKPNTISKATSIDYNNVHAAMDIINYLNTHLCINYHLILCSFSVPLVLSKWEELICKPKSLTLICPLTHVSLPWPVRLFSSIPNATLPYMHQMVFNLANRTSAIRPICKNHLDLFKGGNIKELSHFQSSVREVLKLKISHDLFEKVSVPTLIVKPMSDKIHRPGICHKIYKTIKNSVLHEVDNFRDAHSVDVAREVQGFIAGNIETKEIMFKHNQSLI